MVSEQFYIRKVSKFLQWLSPKFQKFHERREELIYDRVKEICDRLGLSILQVEKAAGLGNGTIRGWRYSMPRIDTVQAVARVLGVSLEELTGGEIGEKGKS